MQFLNFFLLLWVIFALLDPLTWLNSDPIRIRNPASDDICAFCSAFSYFMAVYSWTSVSNIVMSYVDVVYTEKSDVFWRHLRHSSPRFSSYHGRAFLKISFQYGKLLSKSCLQHQSEFFFELFDGQCHSFWILFHRLVLRQVLFTYGNFAYVR
jgi:hypothetical protein